MRVGLTLWGFAVGARAAVDLAVLAEQRGFDSVFMVEGVLSNWLRADLHARIITSIILIRVSALTACG